MKIYNIYDSETLELVKTVKTNALHKVGKKRGILGNIIHYSILFTIIAIVISLMHQYHQDEIRLYKKAVTDFERSIEMMEQETEIVSMTGHYYMMGHNAEKFNDTAALILLEGCGAWYPDIILAQLQLESHKFQSDVGKNAINGFGMKKISERGRHRPTTQIPGKEYYGYGMYSNWQLSVIDRVLWDVWSFKGIQPSRDKYLKRIEDLYAEDVNYIAKIKSLTK